MQTHSRSNRLATLLLPLALLALTGCPPRGKPIVAPPTPEPLPIADAVAAVNDNVAGITQTLAGGGIAISAIINDEGKTHRYDLTGTLRYLPPHYLYLDLGHSLEPSAMRLGSNDTQFWAWVKPERNELWYGRWADLDPADAGRMPLPPDMILAAMGLSPLPTPGQGLLAPIPRIDDERYYKLLYVTSADDHLWIQREYWLDRFPPYLPRVIIFGMPDGTQRMRATLDRYERVGNSSVYVAREIRMVWPDTRNSLSMRLGKLSFNERIQADSAAFRFDRNKTPIPRDRQVLVTRPRQGLLRGTPPTTAPATSAAAARESLTTAPSPIESPAGEPSPAQASEPAPGSTEPAATRPARDEPTLELESSPE